MKLDFGKILTLVPLVMETVALMDQLFTKAGSGAEKKATAMEIVKNGIAIGEGATGKDLSATKEVTLETLVSEAIEVGLQVKKGQERLAEIRRLIAELKRDESGAIVPPDPA